jgi:hypothetical protein
MKHAFEHFLDSFPSSPVYHDDDYKLKAAVLFATIYLGYSFCLGVYRCMCR